ncbi:MAG: sigma-70 family RNA polymerase sigma factor [Synechococcaceae cyanobacterium ELA263]
MSKSSGRQASAIDQRNHRVELYRALVRPIALHYASCSRESSDDLLQVGLLGLIRAAELYRQELETPFSAFARPHIRGAILHYLRDCAPAVRLPRRQVELQERIQKLLQAAAPGLDQGGREALVRQRLGLSEQQWQRLAQQRQLNRMVPLEGELLEGVVDPSKALSPEEAAIAPVEVLLAQLEPRQRQVVRQVVLAGWSYRRLAQQMQVSPMTIQRLLHRGLAQLRSQLDRSALRPETLACSAGSAAPGC